jgi:hypothetical protein
MKPLSDLKQSHFTLYLLTLSILGSLLVFITTSAYGPGISSDGMEYIAAADNLLRGQGFTNFHGEAYILWPPLYPVILAGLHLLTGLDVIIAGWILNALSFGLILYLTGVLMEICFPANRTWAVLGVFISFFSTSYLTLAANISSDSLFIAMLLGFLIACQRYLADSSRRALAAMFVLAMLAPLQRFLGVCIVVVGALAVLVRHWGKPWKAFGGGIPFGLGASLPTLAWVIGRNYLLYGSLTGPRHFQDAYPLLNLAYHTRMILRWFIPLSVLNRLPLWIFPSVTLVILLVLARRTHWTALFNRLKAPSHWPMLAFSLLYLLILIPTTITSDHTHPYDDRFQAVIFAPALVLVFTLLQETVINPLKDRGLRLAQPLVTLMIVIWSIYPVSILQAYVKESIQNGEAIYNLYNHRRFQESPVVRYLMDHPLEPGLPVYSNDPEAAYLFSRQITHYSPRDFENNDRNDEYLLEHYRGWPEEGTVYLVWFFARGDRRNFFNPGDLAEIATVESLFTFEQAGGVYIVRSRHR